MSGRYYFIDPAGITLDKARRIRAWRTDQELTWRGVAASATETWGSVFGDNQLYGRELCVAAARVLGEDPDDEPWN